MSTLGEIVATSDVPAGVVNLLTGDHAPLLPWLADHDDVDLIDLTGAPEAMRATSRPAAPRTSSARSVPRAEESLRTALAYCEIKTVWHPARI